MVGGMETDLEEWCLPETLPLLGLGLCRFRGVTASTSHQALQPPEPWQHSAPRLF